MFKCIRYIPSFFLNMLLIEYHESFQGGKSMTSPLSPSVQYSWDIEGVSRWEGGGHQLHHHPKYHSIRYIRGLEKFMGDINSALHDAGRVKSLGLFLFYPIVCIKQYCTFNKNLIFTFCYCTCFDAIILL